MIIRSKGWTHQPIKQKIMASPVATTMNRSARDRLCPHRFRYNRNEPLDINSALRVAPSPRINELPLATGRTKIPQVFSRSGNGYIEKIDAFTKMKCPRSIFSGPIVLCRANSWPGPSRMNSRSAMGACVVLISVRTEGESGWSVGLDTLMDTTLLSLFPINSGQLNPRSGALAFFEKP